MSEYFSPTLCLRLRVLLHVLNQGKVFGKLLSARMEGSSDIEGDLVGEVFEYLVSGKYCDRATKERKRTIRKKAMKFSVSSRGKLFYKQKKKGKASLFYNGPSRNATKQPLTMYSQTPLVEPRLLAGPYSVLQTGVVNELST